MKILIDKNTTIHDLITQHGSIFDVYGFIPFWFKKEDGSDNLEMLSLDNLPKELCAHIEEMRSETKRCPECGDRGWLYDEHGFRTGICKCHL